MGMPGYLAHSANLAVAATLSASTEDAAFPLANLIDGLGGLLFKMTAASGWIELDLGSAMAVTDVILVNHNLDPAAVVQVKAGAAPAPVTVISTATYRLYDLWDSFASASHRYWRIDGLSTTGANFQLGQLVIGVAVALPRRYAYEGGRKARERSLIEKVSESGVVRSFLRYEKLMLRYEFNMLTEAEVDADVIAFDDATQGSVNPLAWIPDLAGSEVHWDRVAESGVEADSDNQGYWTWQLGLRQESRGSEVT